jgi:hypothetical protein
MIKIKITVGKKAHAVKVITLSTKATALKTSDLAPF